MWKNSTYTLYIEAEQHNIAIFYNIVFPFHTHQTFFFGCSVAACIMQIVVSYYFGTNKAAFKIGMNFAGSARCFGAVYDGPCTDFFWPCSKIAD